jgi:hypothetical protein
MVLRNRTVVCEGDEFTSLLELACAGLSTGQEKAQLAKDFHLIRSALASGQLILSNEVRFPRQVGLACEVVPQFTQLYYGNPRIEGEDCRLWIKAGAVKESNRRMDRWFAIHDHEI